ncbi:MAG: hypothetical protein NZ874_01095 [Fimbriimonadales bacterium]|nr:hypothetical protein [Fimbriimonadales bacterium]
MQSFQFGAMAFLPSWATVQTPSHHTRHTSFEAIQLLRRLEARTLCDDNLP